MKPNPSYLRSIVAILTLLGCCQTFGQQAFTLPSAPQIQVKPLLPPKTDKAPELKKSLVIDFSKINLENTRIDSIKSEIRQGPGSGGGGSKCAFMIKQNTVEILEKIKLYPPFQQDGVDEVLELAIKDAQFYIGKDLYIKGKKVDAINYPVDKAIYVEQAFCDNISVMSAASIGLILHEYLGLAGFDDTEYQVSSDFVKTFYQQDTTGKVGKAAFYTPPMNSLRALFKDAKPIVIKDGKSSLLHFGSSCTYFSEIDGKSLNQSLGMLILSKETLSVDLSNAKMSLPVANGTTILNGYLSPAGMVAKVPTESTRRTAYVVLREHQGSLIGEWTIVGETTAETFRISRTSYPVFAVALRGTLVTGYSVCAPSSSKSGN